jgi:hypothetical protein
MRSLTSFRIALVAISLTVGVYSMASILADMGAPERPKLPSDPTKLNAPAAAEPSSWAHAISLYRSDLETTYALTVALHALRSGKEKLAGQSDENDRVQNTVKQALAIVPYDSELWLALALLQAQRDPRSPLFADALKMSYFVAPNDPLLMPVRLDTTTLFDALSDPDLKELALGDLRLMLTRKTDLKTAVISAYRRASSLGKKFLEESVRSIDPTFVPMLSSQKPI